MTLLRLLLIAATAVLLFLHPAAADEPSLFVAGIEMRIGMPREPLLTRLRSQCKLTQASEDSYAIFEKRGDEYRLVGGVVFQDNKVYELSRDWGAFYGKNAIELANELHSALENLQEASGRPTFLIYLPKTKNVPGLRFTDILFLSGRRKLTLTIIEGDESKGGQQISLQETLY
jgi:hypothetical protein